MEMSTNFAGALRKLSPDTAERIFAPMRQELKAWAIEEEGSFRAERLNGRPGLRRWSGNLSRSLVPIWENSSVSTRAGMMFLPKMQGPDGEIDNYAQIHETGGTIKPKNGRFLAWPVYQGPATTAGGRPRFSGPRAYPGKLFFHQSPGKMYFLAESVGRGKNAKIRMVYHLVKSVEISPKLGFRAWVPPAFKRGESRLRAAQSAAVQAIGRPA